MLNHETYYTTHQNGTDGYWLIWKNGPDGGELFGTSEHEGQARACVSELNMELRMKDYLLDATFLNNRYVVSVFGVKRKDLDIIKNKIDELISEYKQDNTIKDYLLTSEHE